MVDTEPFKSVTVVGTGISVFSGGRIVDSWPFGLVMMVGVAEPVSLSVLPEAVVSDRAVESTFLVVVSLDGGSDDPPAVREVRSEESLSGVGGRVPVDPFGA